MNRIKMVKFFFCVCTFAASPVSIPPRSCATHRPMRSSVEGLNQEIEKLVLVPGQQHSCRPESNHVSDGPAIYLSFD